MLEDFFNIIFEEWKYHFNNIIVMILLSGFTSLQIYKKDKKNILLTNNEKESNETKAVINFSRKRLFLDFLKAFITLFILYIIYIVYRYYNG